MNRGMAIAEEKKCTVLHLFSEESVWDRWFPMCGINDVPFSFFPGPGDVKLLN